jgi:hypothetical protein
MAARLHGLMLVKRFDESPSFPSFYDHFFLQFAMSGSAWWMSPGHMMFFFLFLFFLGGSAFSFFYTTFLMSVPLRFTSF